MDIFNLSLLNFVSWQRLLFFGFSQFGSSRVFCRSLFYSRLHRQNGTGSFIVKYKTFSINIGG